MKTRRKSKNDAAAAAAAAEAEEDGSTQSTQEPPTRTSLSVSLPVDLDLDYLSELVPEVEDWANPDAQSICRVYMSFIASIKDRESIQENLDRVQAELDRKDVELDQALQDRETLSNDLEAALEATKNELDSVRKEREELAASQASLRSQMANVSGSQSAAKVELENLKRATQETEREKRELIGVVDRLRQEGIERDEEIQTLRTTLKNARQEHQTLEAQIRELRSAETSTQFKLESLTQQLQLSQAECDRTASELAAKSEEFAKYRRTKHAEVSQLQASYDSLTQAHAATESSLKALQSAHTAQTHQLTQALTRVQDLTGQLAEQEATYSSEASGLKRLVAMMEERENQAKEIVDNIEKDWSEIGERAERREAALREELERERSARDEAERKVDHLQNVLQKMERGELASPARGGPFSTPARGHDEVTDGMMGLSPTVAMASKMQSGGKTFTEVYSEHVQLQQDYDQKSLEYDQMERTLESVLAQIQERAPILSQQREEYARLQSEASQLAQQLSQALSDRDSKASLAQENHQKFTNSIHENELLQKQLEDLGRQVRALLKRLTRHENPVLPSDNYFEEHPIKPAENIEEVITDNLVLFVSIDQLQEQNQKLLKIVRELGAKMEAEEKEYRAVMEKEQGEAVREAHEAIQELAAELERQRKSSETTIQAYAKERDTLRSMLARAEKNAAARVQDLELDPFQQESGPKDEAGLAKELAETQKELAMYRAEMGFDSVRLREDLIASHRDVGKLSAALAKANAKIEFLTDRQRMSHEELMLQTRNNENLTMRNQKLYDQYTRVDIECNRVSEELLSANNRVEQLRTECANLRAEKKIWENVQSRLVEDNKSLSLERSHLSALMVNVQKMHNDLERSGEKDRRRLEGQLQMLENQTQDLRAQLSQERETLRHVSMQKDLELKELQVRIDKINDDFSKARENLIEAQMSKQQLEQRVEDVSRQLRGNEAKLAVYEGHPYTDQNVAQVPDQNSTREQQLEAEVAELRSALQIAQGDVAAARRHMQQFKEISQANESALATLNSTYDEYKASSESQITRLESEQRALQEKLESAQAEIVRLAEKSAEMRRNFDSERGSWLADKKTLEGTIFDLSSLDKQSENNQTNWEAEVHQSEERAKVAEEKYSREVLAHAESIKGLDALKRQLGSAQTTARDNLAVAETAQSKLSASESSWRSQKDALDKEISDLRARCQDLATQNNLLHQHLESVSSQAARIRQAADQPNGAPKEVEAGDDPDTKLSDLRSVVAYLRKEKEIVDLQLELSKQESARLKIQIEHLSHALEETRATLSEERERAVETATSEAQHAELIERINQLNILRESNATLRADSEMYAKRARELETRLQQLSSQLEPAQERARTAQSELESREGQIKRLEDENRRWQERAAQLLTKYDRIDPAEYQALKDEVERLKTELAAREQTTSNKDDQKARITALEESIRAHRETMAKNNQGFKSRLGQLNNDKSQLNATITELRDQIKELTLSASQTAANEAQALKQEIDRLQHDKEALEKSLAEAHSSKPPPTQPDQESDIAALREERDKLLEEKASWSARAAVSSANEDANIEGARRSWEAERAELIRERDEALSRSETSNEAAKKAVEEAKNAAIAEHDKKIRALQEHEIAAAVERGRMEQAVKGKLKDQALIRAQAKLKKLEAQVLAWTRAGLIPDSAVSTTQATQSPPPSSASAGPSIGQSSSTPVVQSPVTPAARPLPRKPSLSNADLASETTTPPQALAGRGRGVGRGRGMSIRGAAPDPARTTPTSGGVALGVAAKGVSILGAAEKRMREDESSPELSLAKRMKPVAIRRDRVAPPS